MSKNDVSGFTGASPEVHRSLTGGSQNHTENEGGGVDPTIRGGLRWKIPPLSRGGRRCLRLVAPKLRLERLVASLGRLGELLGRLGTS